MLLEAFLICDAATESGGKLNILGAFDAIYSRKMPFEYSFIDIALKMRFFEEDYGKHELEIILAFNGKPIKGQKPVKAHLNIVKNKNFDSASISTRYRIVNIEFKKFGKHEVILKLDGNEIDKRVLSINKIENRD